MYAPVDIQSEYHRILNLFFCNSCVSPASWQCIRLLLKDQPVVKKNRKKNKKKNKQKTKQEENPFQLADEWGVTDWDAPADTKQPETTTDDLSELLRLRDLSLSSETEKKQQKAHKPPKETPKEATTSSSEVLHPAVWISVGDEPKKRQRKEKYVQVDHYQDLIGSNS